MTTFTWNVYLNLSGTAWTDVTDDVLTTPTIHGDYAIKGAAPVDRTGQPGRCTFSLNNSERNTAGSVGYYSPGHANCRSGFDTGINVMVKFSAFGKTKTKWFGKIAPDGIKIITGTYNSRQVQVTCYDYMEDCAVHEITLPSLMKDTKIETVVPVLTAMLPREPYGTSYATGSGTFPYVFDIVRTGGRVSQEFQRLAMSEIGYIFPRYEYSQDGETLVIQGRQTRGTIVGYEQVSSVIHGTILDSGGSAILDHLGEPLLDNTLTDASFDNLQSEMDVTRGDYLYNRVNVITYPRKVVSGTTLWTLDKEFSIPAGGTFLLRATYVDPTGGTAKCGGDNMIQPVGTTDYTCFSAANGGGSSMTSALSFDYALQRSYDSEFLLRNNAAVKMYVKTFKERGDAVLNYNQAESTRSDSTSIATYGTRSINFDMKYEGDATLPDPYAGVMLNRHKDPTTQIKSVKFCANSDDQLMEYFMAIEPGAKIRLKEDVSGQDDDYFVNGVSWDLSGGKKLDCTYYVKRVDAEITVYQYYGQPGTADGNDTYISILVPTGNDGTSPIFGVQGTHGGGTVVLKGLIKFDTSSIPSTANVINASLCLYVSTHTDNPYGAGTLNVYRVRKNWVEDQATWNVYSTGNNWSTAGASGTADYDNSSLASIATNGSAPPGQYLSISLDQNLVEEMISGTYYGFLLVASNTTSNLSLYGENYIVFNSSENSEYKPYLVINYLL